MSKKECTYLMSNTLPLKKANHHLSLHRVVVSLRTLMTVHDNKYNYNEKV